MYYQFLHIPRSAFDSLCRKKKDLSSSLACLRRTVYSTICISADKAVSVNHLWAKTGGKEEELLGNAETLAHLADHTGYLPQVISQQHICSFHNHADHKCFNHYLPKDTRAVGFGRKLLATSRRHEGSGTWQLVSGCWLGPLLAISCSNLLFAFPIHINIAVSLPNMLQTSCIHKDVRLCDAVYSPSITAFNKSFGRCISEL